MSFKFYIKDDVKYIIRPIIIQRTTNPTNPPAIINGLLLLVTGVSCSI